MKMRSTALLMVACLSALCLPPEVRAEDRLLAQQTKKVYYNTQHLKREIVLAQTDKSYIVNNYYENGQLYSSETWQDGKRSGECKYYYETGALAKEITFDRNIITEYVSYVDGKIYTKISKNRNVIYNKGKQIRYAFDDYYEVDPTGYVIRLTKRSLVDFLSLAMQPEEITELLDIKFGRFLDQNPHGAGTDILACAGGQGLYDDNGVDISSLDPGTSDRGSKGTGGSSSNPLPELDRGGKGSSQSAVGDMVNDILGKCAGGLTRPKGSPSAGGVKPGYSKEQEYARTTAQNMASSCENTTTASRKNSLIGLEFTRDDAKTVGQVTEVVAATEFVSELATKYIFSVTGKAAPELAAHLAEVGLGSVGGELNIIASRVAAAAATPLAEVVGAGVGGYAVGTLANDLFAEKLIQASLDDNVQGEHEKEQTKLAAEVQAKKEAQEKAAKDAAAKKAADDAKKASEGTTKSPAADKTKPPPKAPSAKTPLSGEDKLDSCQALRSFVARCENNGWQEFKCSEFVRLVNHCSGSITVINPTPDGTDLAAVGCGSKGDKEAARAETECKKKKMVWVSSPGASGGYCGARDRFSLTSEVLQRANDPKWTDPIDPSFSNLLKQNDVASLNKTSFDNRRKAPRESIVVFIDSDCPSCKSHMNTILSTGMATSRQGYDIAVVEVSQNTSLAGEYGITALPTTFKVSNGKLTERSEGSLAAPDMRKYLDK